MGKAIGKAVENRNAFENFLHLVRLPNIHSTDGANDALREPSVDAGTMKLVLAVEASPLTCVGFGRSVRSILVVLTDSTDRIIRNIVCVENLRSGVDLGVRWNHRNILVEYSCGRGLVCGQQGLKDIGHVHLHVVHSEGRPREIVRGGVYELIRGGGPTRTRGTRHADRNCRGYRVWGH